MKATTVTLDNVYHLLYNAYMDKEPHQTMRVWTKTHKLLRKIAAETDEQLVEVLHRLAQAEWQRIQEQQQCQDHTNR